MNTISYQINQTSGEITWAASEYFGELSGKTYKLDAMEATNIEQIPDLSITAKLLLSAIAGAIIQHLLDQGLPAETIFQSGTFTVKP